MGRIRVLSDHVANKIAAGEVVERPASVVKELLENSLDAGSNMLRIEVESGGRRLIRITDDGCGMLRDDALLAFERHATSKLSDVKDLLSISTLGFRGEALPSIASVSRLTLETRSPQETTGTLVEIAGGKIIRCEEAALASGTVITVRDLFFNVPARKKFLRSDQTELAHIASLATHYGLAYPEKAVELRHEGSDLLHVTPAANLRERVYQVFGSQILDELVDLGNQVREMNLGEPGDETAMRRFALRGFVSRPQIQKGNRNSIYLFVNGRLIRDKLLLHALNAAYQSLIPSNTYPFALLFLECSYEEVDVNVHPSKTEVRFRRGNFIHDFVRDTVRNALIASRPIPTVTAASVSPLYQPAAGMPYSEFSQGIENQQFHEPSDNPAPPPEMPEFTMRQPVGHTPRFDFGGHSTAIDQPTQQPPPRIRRAIPDTHGALPEGALVDSTAGLEVLRELRPMGQLQDSFIIAAAPDGLWIIDQHVAHERILFEKVLRQMAAGKMERQSLLVPLVIELTAGQQVEYERIAAELEASGFEIEPFGTRTIAVKAAPADLSVAEVDRVVFEMLEIAEQEMRRVSLEELRSQMAASIACRAAIKINTPLDADKMLYLLEQLAACDFPMSCPHGRPIALRYPTREILKNFHRI